MLAQHRFADPLVVIYIEGSQSSANGIIESRFLYGGIDPVIMLSINASGRQMRKHSFRLLISFTGCLLAVTPAYADGGISSLGGLLDMIVLFIGAIGLFIIALMFAAISSRKNKTRSNVGIKIIIGISVAYVPLALFFFVMSQESQFVMVPAVTGGCIIALLCVYMFRFGNQASDSRT